MMQPNPRIYRCLPTTIFKIEKGFTDPVWGKAQTLHLYQAWVSEKKRKKTASGTAKIIWNPDVIYIRAYLEDRHIFNLATSHNGKTWLTGDVFEIFVSPGEPSPYYYEFHVTPNNITLNLKISYGHPPVTDELFHRYSNFNSGLQSAVRVLKNNSGKDKVWEIVAAIPVKCFSGVSKIKSGWRWSFSLCRYDYNGGLERFDLSSTSPYTRPNYHRLNEFNRIEFVK